MLCRSIWLWATLASPVLARPALASPSGVMSGSGNRLAGPVSPYLSRHGNDAVDWRSWGTAAFDEARRRDVPVLLSIGYDACHWCRVMEAESFSDPVVGAFINEHFVAVLVDRDERPDIDALYRDALMELIGRSGWPATLFLGPDAVPFAGGIYFPALPSDGRPSFAQELDLVLSSWSGDRDGLRDRAIHLRQDLLDQAKRARGTTLPPPGAVSDAVAGLVLSQDGVHGGWGNVKFPHAPVLELLLDQAALGNDQGTDTLVSALDGMARGGVHDQLGGGFHRTTTDPAWRYPHFEKMLTDNAMLAAVYLDAGRVLGAKRFVALGRETLDWMMRELWEEDQGAFATSLSADSLVAGRNSALEAQQEGAFYTWTRRQLVSVLGRREGHRAIALYRVPRHRSIALSLPVYPSALSRSSRAALLAARRARPRPQRNDVVILSGNGLALTALARDVLVSHDPKNLAVARRLATTLLAAQARDGSLPHRLGPASPHGLLEDHAFVARGLLDLYPADPDPRWLLAAARLGRVIVRDFAAEDGGFWSTRGGAASTLDGGIPIRQMRWQDTASPSGLGASTLLMQSLRALSAPGLCQFDAARTLSRASAYLVSPRGSGGAGLRFASLLRVLDRLGHDSVELVIAGRPDAADTRALIAAYTVKRRPGVALGLAAPGTGLADWPVFAGKHPGDAGAARAWICQQGSCQAPTDNPAELAVQLALQTAVR